MPTPLTAHQEPISRIFSDAYVFNVPGYQRPYAWGVEQARDLLEDLTGFSDGRIMEVENLPPYFLGTIVLIKKENDPEADVVDGQQRLTTLLAAIRANLAKVDADDITKLIYEEGSKILGTRDRFRLSLRQRDRQFFQEYIQRPDGFEQLLQLQKNLADSQRNIRQNAIYFYAAIKRMSAEKRLRLAQFIVTRCYLVAVATPDLESAYRIFSVLNTRGLDLAATDILKAHIIGRISDELRGSYTDKWETTEEDIGRGDFEDLFSHIRMIYRKVKPQGTLLSEIQDYVLPNFEPIHFIDTILIPFANVYEELTDAAYSSPERAESINESLRWLNRLEFNDWLPPALAFAVRNRGTPNRMEEFFSALERLAYALLILRAGANERIERFARLIKSIEAVEDLTVATSPLRLTKAEKFRMYQTLAGPFYEILPARARLTILLRLDTLLSSGGAIYDYGTISVEHVLPQNPKTGSCWHKWFPDPIEREENVHKLGNLVLLTRKKNSAASNYDFAQKKSVYFTRGGISPFGLTTQVLQREVWDPLVVTARQVELLTTFEKYFALEDREDPVVIRQVAAVSGGDITWRDDVREALERLGGRATLSKIYEEVERLRKKAGRSIPRNLDAVVRGTLEDNSSDSMAHKKRFNWFCMPEGRGAGIWALRS